MKQKRGQIGNSENNKKTPFEFLKVIPPIYEIPKNFGQRAADFMTKWAGSWIFILGFGIFLVIWMAMNTFWLLFGTIWDPYPFILLNLALSCLAAIQAPVILMSQNRQAEIDRVRAKYDYAINRKAERELQDLKKQLNRIEKSMMKRHSRKK
jgi:uncharacterized membrane protein